MENKMKKFFLLTSFLLITLFAFQACSKSSSGPSDPPPAAITQIGTLSVTPGAVIVSQNVEAIVNLVIDPGVQVADSSVTLYKADAAGNAGQLITMLYDDGVLSNGDEIKGDNVFSAKIDINEANAGAIDFIAMAVVINAQNKQLPSKKSTVTVYSNLTAQEYNEIVNTQSQGADQLNTYIAGNVGNLDQAVTQLAGWLDTQAAVESVEQSGSSVMIKYSNGMYGAINVAVEEASGTTRGSASTIEKKRKQSKAVPVSRQTRGDYYSSAKKRVIQKASDLDPKLIGNRNVMIYAPYEAAFAPHNEGSRIVSILNGSGFEFEIDYYTNQNATVSVLKNLTNYGLVVLATHGSAGKAFYTGEIVDTNSTEYQNSYKALIKSNKLFIALNMVIAQNGDEKTRANVYGVRGSFISDLAGSFPNSVILNNSCESTKSNELSNAFIGKGAKTYYGYDKIVSSSFCVLNADTLIKRLAKDLKTTGESFMAGSDPASHGAAFQMVGANDVRFPDEFINGDFEYGKLTGWTKAGDGRVISKLGFLAPTGGNYMGIISTGLGYTTSTGSVQQTFTLKADEKTLEVKWNFLSEEFLEYIGSIYQDYFEIKVKDKNGNVTSLSRKTIDGYAADFGATDSTAGNLVKVSPDIVFDRGGVYMTGWQSSTYDLSPWAGQRITLIFAAGDVGDSIYDSAILLDDIYIKK